uniref:DNA helicase n=1 Tax=Spongospora subterranea TaxID=70186 RepID=A0A0H5R8H0_9EUKA|eukprot:CRZ10012.1 hypothetical protein [Spongospora subterranea]
MPEPNLISSLQQLVSAERQAEADDLLSYGDGLPIRSLEAAGLAIRRLHIVEYRTAIGGRIELVMAPTVDSDRLLGVKLSSGDIVQIRTGSNTIIVEMGTVVRLTSKVIIISCSDYDPSQSASSPFLTLVKVGNDISFRRCAHALDQLASLPASAPCNLLASVLLASQAPSPPSSAHTSKASFDTLNTSQSQAVLGALATNDVFLIHGPPGCGKTTAVCRLITEAVKSGLKVLACAPSNIAVDGIVERLSSSPVRLVRLGHPARMLQSVMTHSLDEIVSRSEAFRLAQDVRSEIRSINERWSTCSRIERNKNRDEIRLLRKDLKAMEGRVSEEVVGKAQVVLSTCVGANVPALRGRQFDLVIIDEAGQALEPQCWIPILMGKRLVMVGDHKQLAPTVKSSFAATFPTMFERVYELLQTCCPQSIVMLDQQYRMNSLIQDWSSQEFYNGRLIADRTVAHHLLHHLPGVKRTATTAAALVYIDTSHCSMDEDEGDLDGGDVRLRQLSKGNIGEARIAALHLIRLLWAGVSPGTMALLTPYSRQVVLCRQALTDLAQQHNKFISEVELIEIGTIDGFQGREKEAIVISMVRSNTDSDIGFLSDPRRINVACTRARRHLAVICDSSTLSHDPFFNRLLSYLEDNGDYQSAHLYEDDAQIWEDQIDDDCADVPKNDAAATDAISEQSPVARPSKPRKSAKGRRCKSEHVTTPNVPIAKSFVEESVAIARDDQNDVDALIARVQSLLPGEEVVFPCHLTSFMRMVVHDVAERCRMDHGSSGEGAQRFVWVKAPLENSSIQVHETARRELLTPDKVKLGPIPSSPDDLSSVNQEETVSNQEERPTAPFSNIETLPGVPIKHKKKRSKAKTTASAVSVGSVSVEDEIDEFFLSAGIKVGQCSHSSCMKSTKTVSIVCQFCKLAFCISHGLPEVHGCGTSAQAKGKVEWIKECRSGKPPSKNQMNLLRSNLKKKVSSFEDGRSKKKDQSQNGKAR